MNLLVGYGILWDRMQDYLTDHLLGLYMVYPLADNWFVCGRALYYHMRSLSINISRRGRRKGRRIILQRILQAKRYIAQLSNNSAACLKHLCQKVFQSVALRAAEDLIGSAFLCYHSVVKEEYPIGDLSCEAHFMGDDYHRHSLPCKLLHNV